MVSTYTQVSNIRLIYNDECMTAKYFKSRIMLCDYSAQLQNVCAVLSIRKLNVFMTSASFALRVG